MDPNLRREFTRLAKEKGYSQEIIQYVIDTADFEGCWCSDGCRAYGIGRLFELIKLATPEGRIATKNKEKYQKLLYEQALPKVTFSPAYEDVVRRVNTEERWRMEERRREIAELERRRREMEIMTRERERIRMRGITNYTSRRIEPNAYRRRAT